MVTRTGKIIPSGSFCVLALNCLQKSMILTPCGPSAVPTGGAGVALPADNCNLMVVCTFFGGMFPLPQEFFAAGGAEAPPLQNDCVYPSFSTLAKSSSTGVERPKTVTDTLILL